MVCSMLPLSAGIEEWLRWVLNHGDAGEVARETVPIEFGGGDDGGEERVEGAPVVRLHLE